MLNNFSVSERKVAIIGAGFVGASIAYALTIRKLAREIVLQSGQELMQTVKIVI